MDACPGQLFVRTGVQGTLGAEMNLCRFVAVSTTTVILGAEGIGIQLPGWMIDSLKQSPGLVFGLVIFWLAFKHIQKEHAKHLGSKDAEIDRLVKERDKLQNVILKNRLSTEEPPSPPGEPKGKGKRKS